MKYRFAYSGEDFEGFKDFMDIKSLRNFLKDCPEYELKNSVTYKFKNGNAYLGQYIKNKDLIRF